MRKIFVLLAALAPCIAVAAESPSARIVSAPVLVVMQKDQALKAQVSGSAGLLVPLIGMWATASVNKNSARKVERFKSTLAPTDISEQATSVFNCFATTTNCTEGKVFVDAGPFSEAVRANPAHEGYVVQLLPELVTEQVMIRASAHRVYVANDSAGTVTHEESGYFALYTTRAPAEILASKKKPAPIEEYWSQGEPRRIVEASRRGLVEINTLFAMQIRDEGLTDPTPTLTNLKDFPDKKRLACKGGPVCAMTYLFKDNGDSVVLVFGTNYAGWLDAAAAAHEAGLPGMVTYGVN